jgi:hypothetical protein
MNCEVPKCAILLPLVAFYPLSFPPPPQHTVPRHFHSMLLLISSHYWSVIQAHAFHTKSLPYQLSEQVQLTCISCPTSLHNPTFFSLILFFSKNINIRSLNS